MCERNEKASKALNLARKNLEMAIKFERLAKYCDENFNELSDLFSDIFEDTDGETYELIDTIEDFAVQMRQLSEKEFHKAIRYIVC